VTTPPFSVQSLHEILARSGDRLPEETRKRILSHGQAVAQPLLALLKEAPSSRIDDVDAGTAKVHAVGLLADLQAADAVAPMLEILKRTEGISWIHDRTIEAMKRMGQVAFEPALLAYQATDDDELRHSLCAVLPCLGVRDEGLFQILLRELEKNPDRAAGWLADYGDPRGLECLARRLDAFEIVDNGSPFANHAVIEMQAAIQKLDGRLTPSHQQKYGQALELAGRYRHVLHEYFDSLRQRRVAPNPTQPPKLDAPKGRGTPVVDMRSSMPLLSTASPSLSPNRGYGVPSRRLGRNERCWCGSGKKYKKCHWASDHQSGVGK